MSESESVGSSLIWGFTTILVVAMIVGAIFYSGVLTKTSEKKIDVNIDAPKVQTPG